MRFFSPEGSTTVRGARCQQAVLHEVLLLLLLLSHFFEGNFCKLEQNHTLFRRVFLMFSLYTFAVHNYLILFMRALSCVGPHGVCVWNVANGMFAFCLIGECCLFFFCLRLTIWTGAHPRTVPSAPNLSDVLCALFST